MVARQNNLQPGHVLLDLARGADSSYWSAFTGRAALSLADIGGMLATWRIAAQSLTIPELFDRIVSDINFKEYIDDNSDTPGTRASTSEGEDRWDNVLELKRLAEEYSTRTMDEFLENIALGSDQDTIKEGNVPTLLTLHAAKGLEFGAVFIVGLDDGMLPHSRSFDEPEQMEEERRLFYVGITRAKDKLYLVRSIRQAMWAIEHCLTEALGGHVYHCPDCDQHVYRIIRAAIGIALSARTSRPNTGWSTSRSYCCRCPTSC